MQDLKSLFFSTFKGKSPKETAMTTVFIVAPGLLVWSIVFGLSPNIFFAILLTGFLSGVNILIGMLVSKMDKTAHQEAPAVEPGSESVADTLHQSNSGKVE